MRPLRCSDFERTPPEYPADQSFHEVKMDGYRMMAGIDGRDIRLVSHVPQRRELIRQVRRRAPRSSELPRKSFKIQTSAVSSFDFGVEDAHQTPLLL